VVSRVKCRRPLYICYELLNLRRLGFGFDQHGRDLITTPDLPFPNPNPHLLSSNLFVSLPRERNKQDMFELPLAAGVFCSHKNTRNQSVGTRQTILLRKTPRNVKWNKVPSTPPPPNFCIHIMHLYFYLINISYYFSPDSALLCQATSLIISLIHCFRYRPCVRMVQQPN